MGLGGCARSYVFEELRSGYQKAELPAVFANGKGRLRLSGYAAFNGQQEIAYSRESAYETSNDGEHFERHPVHGVYSVRRDVATFGGSAIVMGSGPFAGLSAGTAAPHPEHWHMGVLAGWTRRLGPVTPMISAGSYLNHVSIRARYYAETRLILGQSAVHKGSSTMEVEDVSWPLKLGLMAHVGPVSPYAVIGRDATRYWPNTIQDDGGMYTVASRELTLGCRFPAPAGASVSIEAGSEWAEVDDILEQYHWTGRVRFELDRF
jgi:hypothetical protein